MDVVRELLRGVVPVHVLHHAAEEPVHGAWMAAELARHGYAISPGTLYPLLHRMQDAGLLDSEPRTFEGRALRCYHTTEQGRRALGALRQVLAEVTEEVLPDLSAARRDDDEETSP